MRGRRARTPEQMQALIRARTSVSASGCWVWTGRLWEGKGYGSQTWAVGGRVEDRAHRVAWTAWRGLIPPGQSVLHTCDNPPCCNPDHLRLGTAADNMADMRAKGRQATFKGEKNSQAKLTVERVRHFRAEVAGGKTVAEVAREAGLNYHTVYGAVKGDNWRHV